MRLHRSISADRPLLVVALEEEAAHLHVTELPVLVTGVGKVNAAVAVATILGEFSPSAVVNLGTAGALRDDMAGTHVIGRVIQHDLDDDALFALAGLRFSEPLHLRDTGATLATGDAFVSDEAARKRLARSAELVDMEGYAVAHAAAVAGVPVMLVKRVSDLAGEGAGRSWRDNVDDCAEHLGAWVRQNLLA
jgi:adenosylhomocysteine nucleosidase